MKVLGARAVAMSLIMNGAAQDLSNCGRSGAPKSQRIIYRILPGIHQ